MSGFAGHDDPLWMDVESLIRTALEEHFQEQGGQVSRNEEQPGDYELLLTVPGRGTVQVRVDVVGVDPHSG